MIHIVAYLSALIFLGHIFAGYRMYVMPMLRSNTDDVPKNVMHAVFHYMTVLLIVAPVFLFADAYGLFPVSDDIVGFIGIVYSGCGIAQMTIALIKYGFKGLVRMFQWVLFLPTGILAVLAAMQ